MATIATIDMLLRAQTGPFSKDMRKATSDLRGLKAQASSTAATLKGMAAGYLSFNLLANQVRGTWTEMKEMEQATGKVRAVLNATGNSAGFTIGQLKDMAEDLERTSQFEDDVAMSAQGVLASFKNIKGDNFKSAMQAAADMATVLDKDLKSSVLTVGKALDNPVKGLAALGKQGVQFSEFQKKAVKDAMALNDVMGAQAIILDELQGKFGGAAAEQMSGYTKTVRDMDLAWKNLKTTLGEIALPKLTPAVEGTTGALKDLQDFIDKNDAKAAKSIQQRVLDLMGVNAFLPDWKFGDAGGRNPRRPGGGSGAPGPTREERRRQDDAAKAAAEAAARMAELRASFSTRLGRQGAGQDGFFRDLQKPNSLMSVMQGLAESAKSAKGRLDALTDTFTDYNRIVAETRTPAENLKTQLADLQRLFGAMPQTPETADTHLRALKKARGDFLGSLPERQMPAALERGTAGAFSATRRGSGSDPVKSLDDKAAKQLTKLDALIRLAEEEVRLGRDRPKLAEAVF